MLTLALVLSLQATSASPPSGRPGLRAHVIRHAAVTGADLDLARAVATALLEAAGITIDWRDCDALVACLHGASVGVSIDVRLLPIARPRQDDASGDVVQEPLGAPPIVLIYLPVIDEKVGRFRLGPIGRSNPSMSRLRRGHLIGVTIAHEIGHALGLRHSARGVMKPDLEEDDILAVCESRFAFLKTERVRMRDMLDGVGRGQRKLSATTMSRSQ
jgi:hypothetical protein